MKQAELITLLQQDREAVFRRIYREAFPKVARLIAGRGGSLEQAKDIFHESLIILYEKGRSEELQIKGSVISYVLGMCRNLWFSQLKNKRPEHPTDDFSQLDAPPEEEETEESERFSLLELLEKAGKKCLDMLQAVYYFRYSMQEIAEEFGFTSTRSATVQKYKCLEKVRDEVKKHQDEPIPA